ncbi:apolipoprotein N-acyltransferase [Fodinibius salsisoli]|uniref:Apolipoprotein N-acyltransferase n=1 Tax=Fodinibius salsisoli TaxID=2820877 RepID=A0ABT3PLD2_9BACT|nr:apolipoprotein N-acyltransferase [Fodinibius salsisoli]MCW9706675.1 apolipoprotein N-acyltransferase [Fodinibius salsisoli]
MNKHLNNIWHSKGALTIIAGVLLGISFPPLPLPFLTFPAFICIFRIVDLSSSYREAAFWVYPGFIIWNLIATYWLMMATMAGGIAAIIANSAVMTIPVMLQYKFQRSSFSAGLIALFQAASWLSFEYLHHHWDLAWPWLTIGNAWSNVPALIQYISITGYWGISFWVLLTASLGYQVIKHSRRRTIIAFGSVFLIFPLVSVGLFWTDSRNADAPEQEIVVVQPNFDSYYPNGGYPNSAQALDHLLQLSDSLRTSYTELIVWPENAIQSRITNLDEFGLAPNRDKIVIKQKLLDWGTTILGGSTYLQFYKEENAPRLPYYDSKDRAYLPFNAALKFSAREPMDVYRKHNLVPIVERVPFVHFLNAIDVFGWINWNQIQRYGKGKKANQFTVGITKTPALICYDSVYPSWIRSYVQNDAGYLTIITNDGWWGNTSGHHQHFAYARLRAIEFGRWIVRSANNGISGIIAPNGSIEVKTDYWTSTAFRYDVPILESQTFYARFGDWLPQFLLLLAFGGFGFMLLRSKK